MCIEAFFGALLQKHFGKPFIFFGYDRRACCLQALSGYASLLDRSSPAVGPASTAPPTQPPDDRKLAAAAGQAAASRSEAAASLLMLLAYIGTTRSLGILVVSNGHLQHIQQSVIPAVSARFCSVLKALLTCAASYATLNGVEALNPATTLLLASTSPDCSSSQLQKATLR